MFNPTISPHDTNTVLISCDMTGSYITHDGGTTWRMFNLRGVVDFFAFDPKDPESVVAGFEEFRHFLRMMEALGELLALLPGCDVLEEQK